MNPTTKLKAFCTLAEFNVQETTVRRTMNNNVVQEVISHCSPKRTFLSIYCLRKAIWTSLKVDGTMFRSQLRKNLRQLLRLE